MTICQDPAPFPVWSLIQAFIALAVSGKKGQTLVHDHAETLAREAGKSPEEIRQAIKEMTATKDAWKDVLGAITDERVKHAIMHEIYTQAYLDGILTPAEMQYAEEIRQVLQLAPETAQEIKNAVKEAKK